MIKISVVIPVYNVEKYLEECLDSVISQTLRDIEIICVNDGSTDNSLEILKGYQKQDDRIIIIDQQNQGVASARNNAIDIAKGKFIAFMDPDDYYPGSDVLECLYNGAKRNDTHICGGSLCSIKKGQTIYRYNGIHSYNTFESEGKIHYKDYQYCFGFTRFIYNLNLLKSNKIYFPPYKLCEDPPFLAKAMICAGEFYALKKTTYCYRENYKHVLITPEWIIENSKGVFDLLQISKENELGQLHYNAIALNDFHIYIYKFIFEGNTEISRLVCKINNAIDYKLLKKYNISTRFPYYLSPSEIHNIMKIVGSKKDELFEALRHTKKVIIYGAGKVGANIFSEIENAECGNSICFAVTNKNNNPDSIKNTPVFSIYQLLSYKDSAIVLVAALGKFQIEMISTLKSLGFKNIMPIDEDMYRFSTITKIDREDSDV
jgi:Glycosyltransferases involved in cell wall biogenesis